MARPSPFTASPTSPAQPFEKLVRDFLSYCKIECGFANATINAYSADLRDLSLFLISHHVTSWRGLTFDLITQHMRDLDKRGMAVSSIARHVATIRVFCRFAESSNLLPTDPAKLLTQPSTWRHLPGVLSPSQMDALLAAPNEEDALYLRDKAMLELLYAGGLRASEIAGLDCDRLHQELEVVRVMGKGSKERIVPIGRPALEAAVAYMKEQRPKLYRPHKPTSRLLLSRNGGPITRIVVWQVVVKYARRAGMRDVHPHMLRHSFATHLLAGGADLRVVQELLGHSNINTTQIYTHVDRSGLKKVINLYHPRERKGGA